LAPWISHKEIIAEIMKWSARWGSPLSREQAEAKADETYQGHAATLGLVHCLYDLRGALGSVYRFYYR
jgi:hypothetical protein